MEEMRLWMCRTQKSMALAGRTRGGRCSKQIKQGSGLERRRAINRKRALGCGATARAAACWAAEHEKWRRVRACSTAGGLRRANAWRQGFSRKIQAGKAGARRVSATAWAASRRMEGSLAEVARRCLQRPRRDGARRSLAKHSRGWFADGMALVAASQAGCSAANGGREARFQQAKVSRGSRAGGRLQQVRCAARAKQPAFRGAG